MTPSVSVVIPCFNLGSFLDEAVQSVLDQTFRDFEILIVDDGSTDPVTRHLLASYRRPATRVLRTENRGVAGARNVGLEQAKGQYVSFLDADDLYEPRFLEATVGLLRERSSLAFASCWLTAFGAKQFVWEPARCDLAWLLAEDTVCTAAPVTREALVAVGGFEESPELDGYEDWALAIALVEHGFEGEILPERLFRYRIRPVSKTSERTGPENHMRVFERLLDKHASSYRRHADGVLRAIGERIDALERLLAREPPTRPSVDPRRWRESILALERHRRALEQALEEGGGTIEEGVDTALAREEAAEETAGEVHWGSLRSLQPVSQVWGLDRGQPVDRHYIERFLEAHAEDVVGDVLEVKDAGYTERFHKGARSVTVLDVAAHNPEVTLIADLSEPGSLPAESYDCVLVTQTLQFVFDVETAVGNLHQALAPGGVALVTVPCVSRIDYESGLDGDFWRLTTASARQLFEGAFGEGAVEVEAFGNVLACTAFLQGLSSEELSPAELDEHDPYFPLLIAIRAVRAGQRESRDAPLIEGSFDEATCGSLSGWAWNPAAPARRLRLEVWEGERLLGSTWSMRFREDLLAAAKGTGTVAFELQPDRPWHEDPPAQISVRAAGAEEPLPGSPRSVSCVCEKVSEDVPTGLLGAALDSPDGEEPLPFPWLEIVGWALGEQGPVQMVELLQDGKAFRRLPLDIRRPDIAAAFPDCSWSADAGFAGRVSLAGAGSSVEIEVEAVLADGRRAAIGRIAGPTGVNALSATAVLDGLDGGQAALWQDAPVGRIVVRSGSGLLGHPGLGRTGGWNAALDERYELIWLSDGDEDVEPDFLRTAALALEQSPQAAFAAALPPETAQAPVVGPTRLVQALSGAGVGGALLLRAAMLRAIGGIDETAEGALQAQWDAAIRLVEAGYESITVQALQPDGRLICERASEEVARALYRKHSRLYERHLQEVLLDRERTIGRLLRESHLDERALQEEDRPLLRTRRRERDRLGAKLRTRAAADGTAASIGSGGGLPTSSGSWRPTSSGRGRPTNSGSGGPTSTGSGGPTSTGATRLQEPDRWGDLYRLQPLSPFWGGERGVCVDRYYIERFLDDHSADVKGRVLAYHDAVYATRYGGEQLEVCEVLDADRTNPSATIVADLSSAPEIDAGSFDCVILPHVLQLLEDPSGALKECQRLLEPGGVLLASVPTIGRVEHEGPHVDFWRFSHAGFAKLLGSVFGSANVEVSGRGNGEAAAAFLTGLAAEELTAEQLDRHDACTPLVILARAVNQLAAA